MADHPPRVFEIFAEIERDRTLEARMELAIAASYVLLGAVELPIGGLMQFLEGLIMAVGDQVAGTLPSLRIAGHGGPRTAQQVAIARQIIQVNWCIDDFVV